MSETITTAAQLDALPVGTILADDGMHPFWRDRVFGWCAANGTRDVDADTAIRDGAPFSILYRPDHPDSPEARIKAEALREAAYRFESEPTP